MTTPNIILLWTDIETTGLSVKNDVILEVAWQLTDFLGNPISNLESFVTIDHEDEHQMHAVLDGYLSAVDVVKDMHTKNGLLADILFGGAEVLRDNVDNVVDMIEDNVFNVLQNFEPDDRPEVRFAGSTVHFDKSFLEEANGGHELESMSHRVFDISTIRPFLLWQDIDMNSLDTSPVDLHRAAADVTKDVRTWRKLVELLQEEAPHVSG